MFAFVHSHYEDLGAGSAVNNIHIYEATLRVTEPHNPHMMSDSAWERSHETHLQF